MVSTHNYVLLLSLVLTELAATQYQAITSILLAIDFYAITLLLVLM